MLKYVALCVQKDMGRLGFGDGVTPGGGAAAAVEMSDVDAVTSIMKGHDSMSAVMSSRGKNLQIVRALYSSQNMKVRARV